MQILSIVLFSISANIDCLAIGLSYGIREIKIDTKNTIVIALISAIGTLLSMIIGMYVVRLSNIAWANMVGCAVIFVTGIYLLYQYTQEHKRNKKVKELADYDIDHSGSINGKEVLALSIGLSANNAGVGIGASIAGIPILLSCILTFFLSVLFIRLSAHLGHLLGSKIKGEYATLLSGLLMVILGIYELFI